MFKKTHNLGPIEIINRANTDKVFGLIALRSTVWDKNSADMPTSVTVTLDGENFTFSGDQAATQHTEQAVFVLTHVMTHLLENGPHNLTITAHWGSDKAVTDEITLNVENTGDLATNVAADLRTSGCPKVLNAWLDSEMFPYASGTSKAWFDEIEPENVPLSFETPATLEDAHRHLERWGFAILPETIPANLVSQFKTELNGQIEAGVIKHTAGSSERILGAHEHTEAGRKIWLYPGVLEFLGSHFRDQPCACQTLTFINGSEQAPHQDTIHLTPYPKGFMCGVWVALEDVQEGSGELFVYPGSHKSERLRKTQLGISRVQNDDYSEYTKFDAAIHALLEQEGYERAVYRPKAGQILVWHENLVHGGSPREHQDRTRLSLVSHYFAKGSIAYYDSRGEAAALEALEMA